MGKINVRDVQRQLIVNEVSKGQVNVYTYSVVKLKGGKRNPYQGKVWRATDFRNVEINSRGDAGVYKQKVEDEMRKAGEAGEFTPGKRAWGERVEGTPFIEHKGEFYLEFYPSSNPEDTSNVFYLEGEDGKVSPIEDVRTIHGYEAGTSKPKVDIRCVKLSNINKIEVGDVVFA